MLGQNSDQQKSNDPKPTDQNCSDVKKLKIWRPNDILVDIYGVISSWNFVKELKNYAKNNLSEYLTRNWNEKIVVNIVTKLRQQSEIDRSAGFQMPVIEKEDPNISLDIIIKSVADNILWQMDHKHNASQKQLDLLFNNIWSDAYNTGSLKTHAFDDVKEAMKYWRFHLFVKIYSYASGPPDGQRLFLRSSVEGDLTAFFANYINSSGGYKYDSSKYRGVISALRESDPKNLLYLTDDPKKARTAIESGMRAIIVMRPGNAVYSDEDLKGLDRIRSFADLQFVEEPGKPAPCC